MIHTEGMTYHLSASIEGLLHNYKRKKLTFMTDDDGNPMSDSQAKAALKTMLSEGKKLIGSSDCSKFDAIEGCLGHTAQELKDEKIANLKAKLAEAEEKNV